MKISSIKRIIVIFLVNRVFAGTRFFSVKRRLLIWIGYKIGENSKIVGPVYNTGKLFIGRDCWIGKNLMVNGNGTVVIGDSCDVAPEVTFLTGGHHIGCSERRAGEGETYTITIGKGTWIGARSTIMGNTSIGNGCVVAACAYVGKNVPSNVLVAGVPAKILRELE